MTGTVLIEVANNKLMGVYREGVSPEIPAGAIAAHPDDLDLLRDTNLEDLMVDGSNRVILDNGALHEKARAAKKEEMKEACKRECQQGITSSALGAPHRYGTRTYPRHDQANLNTAATLALRHTAEPAWTHELPCSADNGATWTRKPHTADQCLQVSDDTDALIATTLSKLQQRKDEIDAAVDQAALDAITWI